MRVQLSPPLPVMQTKRCHECQKRRLLKFFNRNQSKKDGLQTICRDCNKSRSKRYYEQHKEKQKKQIYAAKIKRVKANQQLMLEHLQGKECVDCGETNPVTFEFDHVTDDKTDSVSRLLGAGYSWPTIQNEIGKCDLVCANCHRIRTYTRVNSYRIQQ